MDKICFSLNEILDEVKIRLSYISGKSAKEVEEYRRHAACCADSHLLMSLVEESALWLAFKLRGSGIGVAISSEVLEVSSQLPHWSECSCTVSLINLFRYLVIDRIIYLWLLYSGLSDAPKWYEITESSFAALADKLRIFSKLKPRATPPL